MNILTILNQRNFAVLVTRRLCGIVCRSAWADDPNIGYRLINALLRSRPVPN
jgi:hypothetical protein